MTVIDGLLIFFTIVFLYFLFVYILHKKEILKKYNISLYGPALLLRTTKGINFLKKISSKKRFWKAYGSSGLVFCFICMIIFVLFFLWQFTFVIGLTPEERATLLPGAEFYVILPGINPILPIEYLFYIILALIVAIIVHEFSHGILTLAGDLKVKSMGILYLIFPIGAFVEPDEEQMKKTKITKRMRVYAVGPLSNFVMFFICLLLFSFIFISAVQPGTGLTVFEIIEDSPADEIGIEKGAIITEINGTDLTQYKSLDERIDRYRDIVDETKANETITISYIYNNEANNNIEIKLVDKYTYTKNNSFKGKGHTGIYTFVDEESNLDRLKNPFEDPLYRLLNFISIPILSYFQGYNPIAAPFTDSYIISGPLGFLPQDFFWIIVNSLYWIAWLNLMIGIFNILPMVPLDGGFLFNDAIRLIVKRTKKSISDENLEKIVRKITTVVSLIILIVIISPILLRYF
ncbi:MAG: site-2 protease family protein [Thermoplasmatales archaeon]|nr:MAG: site-2 protease family protein [Thermoplasmatales archaeon]